MLLVHSKNHLLVLPLLHCSLCCLLLRLLFGLLLLLMCMGFLFHLLSFKKLQLLLELGAL